MENAGRFENFDDETVYAQSQARSLDYSTLNFAVEFGKGQAQIAFDLNAEEGKGLLSSERPPERPVRWINIWGPNKQADLVNHLADQYKFSLRLLAVIKSVPPVAAPRLAEENPSKYPPKSLQSDDLELANSSIDTTQAESSPYNELDTSHYAIAKQMLHFQSIDVGTHYLCIGANWMHQLTATSDDVSIDNEGKQRPLWLWLILCDDSTVISLHEDTGPISNKDDIKSIRKNTLSVLSQLSNHGHFSADPISMISVRQALESDSAQSNSGVEGASNLFYYIFDNWRAVYATINSYRRRLKELQKEILEDMTRKSNKAPNIEIIPRLHILGGQIRQMEHLYEGYKNLTQRILEPKATTMHHGASTPRSFSGLTNMTTGSRGVVLARSAATRFERLGDRLSLLILSQTQEFLAEKDALISTYFNINAQKDSESTARLTRSATLLAKISILFLPVSLMTSYFSVQIRDLNNYTREDYWYSFAVIMSVSFLGLFFFARLLMYITETVDGWIKRLGKAFARLLFRRRINLAERHGDKVQ